MPAHLALTGRVFRVSSRPTAKGTVVTELTIPIDTGFGDHEVTTWWRVKVLGKRAQHAVNHIQKGSWVSVTGSPEVRTFEKKNGEQGFSAEMVTFDFAFVGDKPTQAASNTSDPIPF